ncbi:hypothetical protein QUF75_20190 [Desulfococcaceae bacterium HSG7]|nr:hypothetical protein [Desulfococcaceae bacterium HSG7]
MKLGNKGMPRILDMNIILYDDLVLNSPQLTIPSSADAQKTLCFMSDL